MKLSTLAALAKGDFVNAIISETPGGIETQEAAGQRSFVASETLPIECSFCTHEQLEEMGIRFGNQVDDLFVEAELPKGWRKAPCEHSMWSELVDERERKRASIFYKAAFYDRSAHISLVRRFAHHVVPVCGYGDPHYREHEYHCTITDCGEVVWQSQERVEPEPQEVESEPQEVELEPQERDKLLEWMNRKDALAKLGEAWLQEHYPDWKDPLMYWD